MRSPILFVRSVILMCNHNEAEKSSVWVNGPRSGKEQQCGSQSKMSGISRHTYVCAEGARAWARELVEALGTISLQTHSSAGWFFHLGGLSWSEGRSSTCCAESYTLQWRWFDLTAGKGVHCTRCQSGFLSLNQCGKWFSMPAWFSWFLCLYPMNLE